MFNRNVWKEIEQLYLKMWFFFPTLLHLGALSAAISWRMQQQISKVLTLKKITIYNENGQKYFFALCMGTFCLDM